MLQSEKVNGVAGEEHWTGRLLAKQLMCFGGGGVNHAFHDEVQA